MGHYQHDKLIFCGSGIAIQTCSEAPHLIFLHVLGEVAAGIHTQTFKFITDSLHYLSVIHIPLGNDHDGFASIIDGFALLIS